MKKSYLTKKKIEYVEKTYSKNGEIIEKKDRTAYIDYNNNFTKFFHFEVCKYGLSKGSLELLLIIITNLNYGNEVFLTELKKDWTKSYVSLKKAIGELNHKKILRKTEMRGFYILSPYIAYRGDTNTYKKLIGIY